MGVRGPSPEDSTRDKIGRDVVDLLKVLLSLLQLAACAAEFGPNPG